MKITQQDQEKVEAEIRQQTSCFKYSTLEFPLEVIAQMYSEDALYVPDSYAKPSWDNHQRSQFVEYILLGLPVVVGVTLEKPEGAEIVDGVQRIVTLENFFENKLVLEGLTTIKSLNGFTFSKLPFSRQRKFNRVTARLVQHSNGNSIFPDKEKHV